MLSFLFRGACTLLQVLIQPMSSYGEKGCTTQGPAPTQQFISKYSLWGSNPRPMAHKTIALTTELREPWVFFLSEAALLFSARQSEQSWHVGPRRKPERMQHTPFADGHTASNAPDLFRPPKLSGAGPGQYWGGGPPGKPLGCCQLFCLSP